MFDRVYAFFIWVTPFVYTAEVALIVGVLLGQHSVFRKAEHIIWKTK